MGNCPVCKRKLSQSDMHQITYKPQELSIETEDVHDVNQERSSSSSKRKSAIYSEISKIKLAEIKNTELDGPSFTTKVDTLARHLIWLHVHRQIQRHREIQARSRNGVFPLTRSSS